MAVGKLGLAVVKASGQLFGDRQLRPIDQGGGNGVMVQAPMQNEPSFFSASASLFGECPVAAASREQATAALRMKRESPARLRQQCFACNVALITRQSQAS